LKLSLMGWIDIIIKKGVIHFVDIELMDFLAEH
jgi:hypothetical protein